MTEALPLSRKTKPERGDKRYGRSAVSNGKLLPMTDGRSLTARRFADLYQDIGADLGGLDQLSEGQRQLIRRAATLSAESERLEAMWARGEPFDITMYATTANCLRRILETIGLRRVARSVDDGIDAVLSRVAERRVETRLQRHGDNG